LEKAVLKVEGWISGQDVRLLEEEGARCLASSKHLTLDLDGVRFIDKAGMALLKRWSEGGVALKGGSWFVKMLLATHGLNGSKA
jgi:anti-anti-sigma regulatory factor